jgi:hypothetical protein
VRRTLCPLLALALACGPIAAGCGGGDDGDGDGARNSEEAVASCKRSIEGATQLSEDVKSDLKEICEESAEGDEGAVRDASRRVCVKIAEESVPAGPVRDQAVDACNQTDLR